ncbi:MAG: electron transfer flavoprotein subunit alpha/FixB family protein [Candidatus Thermoplasmatota archaeon]|jgi:electron transfer flavoprotein alpha subunit|nr:electron transfer flavoprotein subunit alpha/FixB family protein [Candidatus Thermoplasmatota archaeon]MCL5794043.1 electron transfer flavoprotein subunit alpha/FixB family protein [Candidatus Thermoplasmatota archaeon]
MKTLVYSDSMDLASQIIAKFSAFGEVTVLASSRVAEGLKKFGPTAILSFDGSQSPDAVAGLMKAAAEKGPYDMIAIGSTTLGRDTAGILAGLMGFDVMAEIADISNDGGKVVTKRFFLGGKTVLEEETSSRIFTVTPGIAEPSEKGGNPSIENIGSGTSSVSVLEVIPKKTSSEDIEKASVIVAVGRGIGNREGIDKIRPLAEALNGVIAGSRPVCLDYQWLSEEKQVGLSGKKVRPKVYIALGISGQIQHIAGMRGSKLVVAVNKDKAAPIFEEADYGLVGDLYQIVPKIVESLKA